MARIFNKLGVPSTAVWGDSKEEERRDALQKLRQGEINVLFSVDLFNEGIDLPNVDTLPRHPSQLYEFALEGVAFFVLLWIYSAKPKPVGAVSGMFLIGYGIFRSVAEFFREPEDGFMGVLTLGVSMGQWLSLPMIVAGVWMLVWANRKPDIPVKTGKQNRI